MFKTILFYKPFQVLSQFSAEGEKKTLKYFFKNLEKDIYPIGRLDYDSEGLLLLSNDKNLHHQLLEPKFAHERTYAVQVEGEITDEALHHLESGLPINIHKKTLVTAPAKAKRILNPERFPERFPPIRYRRNIPTSWLSLTLTEGKNRQVRRMTAAAGFPTLRLIRTSIGQLEWEETFLP